MATVNIALAQANNLERTQEDSPLPISDSVPDAAESLTSSGTSQQGASIASAIEWPKQHWTVTASGGAVWVKFGANPTAAAGDDWLVLDGQTRNFGVSGASEKCAVKDA